MGKNEFESFEDEVFKALDHQMRRNILRFIGEGKNPTFTEILNTTKIPDSPTLSYHIRILTPFLKQRDSRYNLTPLGKAAYNLLLRTTNYSREALFAKNKNVTIWSHIALSISAIAAGLVLEVNPVMVTIILPSLAATSLITINKLFE